MVAEKEHLFSARDTKVIKTAIRQQLNLGLRIRL